jgi:hypothetical protein
VRANVLTCCAEMRAPIQERKHSRAREHERLYRRNGACHREGKRTVSASKRCVGSAVGKVAVCEQDGVLTRAGHEDDAAAAGGLAVVGAEAGRGRASIADAGAVTYDDATLGRLMTWRLLADRPAKFSAADGCARRRVVALEYGQADRQEAGGRE